MWWHALVFPARGGRRRSDSLRPVLVTSLTPRWEGEEGSTEELSRFSARYSQPLVAHTSPPFPRNHMPNLSTPMHYLFLSPLLELRHTVHLLLTSGLEVATVFGVPYPLLRLMSTLNSHRQLAGCWGSVHSFCQTQPPSPVEKDMPASWRLRWL